MIAKDIEEPAPAVVGLRRMHGYSDAEADGRSAAGVKSP
jgi:hypothetical protein